MTVPKNLGIDPGAITLIPAENLLGIFYLLTVKTRDNVVLHRSACYSDRINYIHHGSGKLGYYTT